MSTSEIADIFDQAVAYDQMGRLAEAEAIYRQILKVRPDHFDSMHLLGICCYQRGQYVEAICHFNAALKLNPNFPAAYSNLGIALRELKRFDEAIKSFDKAIALRSDYVEAFNNRGITLAEIDRPEEAVGSLDRAIALKPDYAEAFYNRGNALKVLGRLDEALASFDRAIALKPNYAQAFNNRGNILRDLKRFDEALASYDCAISHKLNYAGAFHNRGCALAELKRFDEAIASYDRAIAFKPNFADAFYNRGFLLKKLNRLDRALASFEQAIALFEHATALDPNFAEAFRRRGGALVELNRFDEAIANIDRAIALKPDDATTFSTRGDALKFLRRFAEALASYDRAIALKPNYPEAFHNRGSVLADVKRFDEAIASYDRAIALKPNFAEAFRNRGSAFEQLKRFDQALASYDAAIALEPSLKYVKGLRLHAKMHVCDWKNFDEDCLELIAAFASGKAASRPFTLAAIPSSAAFQRACAELYVADNYPTTSVSLWTGERYVHDRIRIAYLSADFHAHATAHLMAGVFESHDKSRFETIAVSFGPDDKSRMRRRLVRSFDRFIDVRAQSDQATAQLIRELEIDIAIDLKGFTQDCRFGIFARRPAPIQANYLGFPGTTGANYIDYIIADRFVIPPDQLDAYSEKVVYLPDSYQANDKSRPISKVARLRAQAGLPENAFVFCCFNNNYKIIPKVFDVWTRLLRDVAGSVLWLLEANSFAVANLRREAEKRGIDPDRLIFAPRMKRHDHLGRHRLADLFLDTVPYNAHTTASDALWTGLPVVTCAGTTFASRVAGSLLNAVGLPELITHSLEDYEALALKLARDPVLLRAIKQKVERNRHTCPLFNAERFTRHLETAYATMWQRYRRGEAAENFAVVPLDITSNVTKNLPQRSEPEVAPGRHRQPSFVKHSPTAPFAVDVALNEAFAYHEVNRLAEAEALYRKILKTRPVHFDSTHLLGVVYLQRGDHAEALRHIDAALKLNGNSASAHFNRGLALRGLKQLDDAIASYDRAIALKPDYAEAFNNRGNASRELKHLEEALSDFDQAIALRSDYTEAFNNRAKVLKDLKRFAEAVASYDQAIALNPYHVDALINRGKVLRELKRFEEALASYDQSVALKPDCAEGFVNRGIVLRELKRLEEAVASYDKAIALKLDHAGAYHNRGIALQELNRLDEALASYAQALVLKPDHAGTFNNRGIVLLSLRRVDEALASFDKAIALRPEYPDAFCNRGIALMELKRIDDALASYVRAIALDSDHANALMNRGNALRELRRLDEAIASYDRAIALRPDYAKAYSNRGMALRALNRLEQAVASFDKAIALKSDQKYLEGARLHTKLRACDWKNYDEEVSHLLSAVLSGKPVSSPFELLATVSSPAAEQICAKIFIADREPPAPTPLWHGERYQHDRIRIAYVSGDFHDHATAYLMAGLFGLHDRTRFEIIGISYGVSRGGSMRARLKRSFERFIDVHTKSNHAIAELIRNLEVDIAIDLKAFTEDARIGVFSRRPAPIQVNYLGYPGTMGAEFIDYIIADRIVLPLDQQRFYAEKIVHLPDCYQVNDSKRQIASATPTRQEVGLPDSGFVFCCFNNNYKITPLLFGVWMRLLQRIDASVLWLFEDTPRARANLCKEAAARGVDPARLVFAHRIPHENHLARHRLADLFLDTLPYNAHTTASDALWGGLPVLTCYGESFPGRVATSLLNAIGLPELVTSSIEEYEAMALKLASEPHYLESIRQKLEKNRLTYPLFDTDRFRRHIEAAYITMWDLWQQGKAPRSFNVEPVS